jgi:hypothetical protein
MVDLFACGVRADAVLADAGTPPTAGLVRMAKGILMVGCGT